MQEPKQEAGRVVSRKYPVASSGSFVLKALGCSACHLAAISSVFNM